MHTLNNKVSYLALASFIILALFFLTPSTTQAQTPDCSFTRDLSLGSRGQDVNCLQRFLQAEGFLSGNTTTYFGPITENAVSDWQQAEGISPAEGYFGPVSQAQYRTEAGIETTNTTQTTQTVSNNTQDSVRSALQEQIRELMQQVISLLQQKLAQTLDRAGIDRAQFADALGDNIASRASNNHSSAQGDNRNSDSSNDDSDDQEESDDEDDDSGGGGGGGSSDNDDDPEDDNQNEDTEAPTISSISESTDTDSATISWDTNEPADSEINYGTTDSYGDSVSDNSDVTDHSLDITGLSSDTTYHYQISSTDNDGNTQTTDNRTFTTDQAQEESDPGTVQGDRAALMAFYNETGGDNWDNNDGWGGSASTMDDWYGVTTYSSGPNEGRVKEIRLKSNNLDGEIPAQFGDLDKLTHLRVKGNSLAGPIDTFIDDLESAEWLSFSAFRTVNGQDDRNIDDLVRFNHEGKDGDAYNGFTGTLPDSIADMENLRMLEISGSHLTGTLPPELPPNMQALFIQSNDMHGTLPPAWGEATDLTHLYINQNFRDSKYTGTIPEEWSSLTKMAWFTFKGNDFDGPFPEFIEWTDLRLFAGGGGNEFGGEFPFWLMIQDDKHRSLHTLELGGTGFTGELPDDVSPYFDPSTFSIMDNNLTGDIPSWFEDQFKDIVQILWTGNSFSGSFPDVSDFSDLRFIEVAGNEFTGSLPEIDPNNGTLNIVSFHNNNFTGTIPESWGNVVDGVFRRGLRIPGNEIEGKIPARLGEVVKNRFVVYDNKFVFADLIEVVEMLQSASDFEDDRGIDFAPQKPFGDAETIALSPEETFNYDFSNKSHPDDSYQWTKDGVDISGETSASISISNVDSDDAGKYRLKISNPFGSVEDGDGQTLGTLESEPITVTVGDVQGVQTTSNSLQTQLDLIWEQALELLNRLKNR